MTAISSDKKRRLADDVELEVVYADETRFGGLPSGKLRETMLERCASVLRHSEEQGGSAAIANSAELLAAAQAGPLRELYAGPEELLPEVIYPPAEKIRPAALALLRERRVIAHIPLTPGLTKDLARWIGDFARGVLPPRGSEPRALYDAFRDVAAFTDREAVPLPPSDGHFVGHATVAIRDGQNGFVLIDPYLLPSSERFRKTYQPIAPAQLGVLSAVCITHSHPDHFSPGSLLKLGAETPIVVPRVERESALSIAMGARLRELGFEAVIELGWGEERTLPGGKVTALPFFGEQPSTLARLHPEARNQGNTYLVEVSGRSMLAVADSGTDSEGGSIAYAEAARKKYGRIEVLFGGYRAFPQYPIEYLSSSVPEFLLFVPKEAWLRRQKIMYDAEELMDLAEVWGARTVVPYACGGAPWYWERGLGPILDTDRVPSRADPVPESVAEAARWRTGGEGAPNASPVDVVLLRPGDGFQARPEGLAILREPPHAWPYPPPSLPARLPAAEPSGAGMDDAWLQFNVALRGDDESERRESAWGLFRRVVPVVAELKETGRARTFFFQWKPPGIRLRIELTDHAAGAREELRFEIHRALRSGAIESYASAVYEPETRIFGGPEAMNAVHRYFDADTTLAIEREALERSTVPHRMCDVTLWLAFIADDLAVRTVRDFHECWDVYARLLEMHQTEADGSASPIPPQGLELFQGERDLLVRHQDANRRFAADIAALVDAGQLLVGRRLLVANMIQFQLNRHRLEPAEQRTVVSRLLRTRDPAVNAGLQPSKK